MKTFTVFLVAVLLTGSSLIAQKKRYLDEIFNDVVKEIEDQIYSINVTVLYYPEFRVDTLRFDLYLPAGDTETSRPLAVVLHNSSFLPRGLFAPTGDKDDYADTEICTRLAKRGYVAAAIQYRKGWNPVSPSEIERRATIIQATYRSIQDMYAFLRYMNMTVVDLDNPYGVCMDKVALFGLGSGAFTSLNAAVLNSEADIQIEKYINPVDSSLYINPAIIGDLHGIMQGAINIPNHVGYPDDFHFAFGFDGALGDAGWLESSDQIPLAAIGVISHPTTPFGLNLNGEIECDLPVFGPAGFVVNVGGSVCLISKANDLCMNAELVGSRFDDSVSQSARENPYAKSEENVFPVNLPGFQTAPWEYWDSTFWDMIPGPCGGSIDDCSKLTNPDMSLEKANAYIDTAIWFFTPRAYAALNLEAIECNTELSCDGIEEDDFIVDDFECLRPYTFGSGNDRLCIIDNPQQDADNSSLQVGAYRDPANDPWAALCVEFGKAINFDKSAILEFQINAPIAAPLLVKLEGSSSPAYETWLNTTSPGNWETMTTDFSSQLGENHTKLCFFPNAGYSNPTDDMYLFDNLTGLKTVGLFTPTINPLEISPNPVSHTLYIRNLGKSRRLRLISTLGQIVSESQVNGEDFLSIPMADVLPGIFILGAYDENGEVLATARIMKN